ncbi:gas vesicle protein K [Actinomadura macra]|uniref:gas vesicle protein K n=1 Tax=Actinomadura macra TaxID=46164 RepID=UPI0009FCBCBB|nr:gas vesicle protein K [Actinomadura macra]
MSRTRREPVTGEVSVSDPQEGDRFTDDVLAGRGDGAAPHGPVRAVSARGPGPSSSSRVAQRLRTDPETVERDLVKLVLTLVELIRQLMERQALRRAEGGDLTAEQVERLGLALMRLDEAMVKLKDHFGLDDHDLNLDLGPLGTLLPER